MSAALRIGPASPFDPFQGRRAPAGSTIEALAERWSDLTRQIDDAAAYKQAERVDPPYGGDKRADRLWTERKIIEAKILVHAEPTVDGIAAKLRMLAWSMNVENAECANRDGVRTNELTDDEQTIASALADAERLAGRAP
jgi:hypothetical protein